MSTISRSQRIGIWFVAFAMLISTVVMILLMINPQKTQEIMQEAQVDKYKAQAEAAQAQYEEDRKNMIPLSGYDNQVKAFKAEDIKEVATETLTEGNGATVKEGDKINVEYTVWTADGGIIDSSTRKDQGANAIDLTLDKNQVIEGWVEGLKDQKVGGVYLLSIPADKAYGDEKGPLKFIVKINSIVENK